MPTKPNKIKLSDILRECRNDNLTIANLHALSIIHESGRISAVGITDAIGVAETSIKNYANKLVNIGLIESVHVKCDGFGYQLTDLGKRAIKALQMTGGAK